MSLTFADPRLGTLDGFRVDIDPVRERGDVVLDRPPFNIVSMPQRDQLRLVFEALDDDARVRVIVLRAAGEHFSSGGNIKGFMEATPEYVSRLAWNIAAPARCAKPVIAANRGYCFGVGFELSLACDFRIVSDTCFYALPEQRLGQIPGSGGFAHVSEGGGQRALRTRCHHRFERGEHALAVALPERHEANAGRNKIGGDRVQEGAQRWLERMPWPAAATPTATG